MSLFSCLIIFAIAFGVAAVMTPAVRWFARQWGVVDRPDHFRKVHQKEVPRLGGVAIYIAFLAAVTAVFWFPRSAIPEPFWREAPKLLALLIGAAVALGLGIFDDVFELAARWKLVVQVVAATVAFMGGYVIDTISIPFSGPLTLGMLTYPVTVIWFLACMNAINLLDGLDGLAAGASLFAALTLFLVGTLYDQGTSMILMACLAGSTLGFLIYNFYPASIFLGDSGSLLLGFLIAALALLQKTRKAETALTLLVPLIALGVPLFDTLLAILRRWSRRLPISSADRQHIHHVLMALGLSHRRAVLILYGACVVLGAAAYVIAMGRNEITVILLSSLAVLAFVSVRVFGGMRVLDVVGRVSDDFNRMGRAAKAKLSLEKCLSRLPKTSTLEELWSRLADAFASLDLDSAALEIHGKSDDDRRRFTWPATQGELEHPTDMGPDFWFARLALREHREALGELQLMKLVYAETLMPEAPELVEKLRVELARHVARLTATPPKESIDAETDAAPSGAPTASDV